MTVTAVPIPPTKRGLLYLLWAGVIAAVLGGVALATLAVPADPNARLLARNRHQPGVVQTASGLQYKVLRAGSGATTPTDRDVVLVNYEGKLPDGTTFDKSPQPTPFAPTDVVPGFGEAVKLMKKGAKYRFWIKPTLGYGAPRPAGAPPLEGKAAELARQVLIFDVEMVDFLPQEVVRQRMQQMQALQQMQQQGAAGAPPPR